MKDVEQAKDVEKSFIIIVRCNFEIRKSKQKIYKLQSTEDQKIKEKYREMNFEF